MLDASRFVFELGGASRTLSTSTILHLTIYTTRYILTAYGVLHIPSRLTGTPLSLERGEPGANDPKLCPGEA